MLSCKFGFSKLVDVLISHGANVNEKNILGETALSIAQINHHDDLAMKMLKQSQIKFN
jgi:ankyrin repeat protein